MYSNWKEYSILYFKFTNYTSELLDFRTLKTNMHSHLENYQPVPLVSLIANIFNGRD